VEELIQLLRSRFASCHAITAETPLMSSGLVDSFAIAELLAELERHFQVKIEAADIGVDNFDTPAQMLEFMRARL
jgi:acyl carrier protein